MPPVVLDASFDETWGAVVQTFFDRNIPVRTVEKASGLLESDDLRGEIGRDCDCGTYLGIPVGGYGGAYGGDAAFRYRVLVEARPEGSSLTLRSTCRARVDTVEGELVCRLDPAREAGLREAIVSRVGRSAPASR